MKFAILAIPPMIVKSGIFHHYTRFLTILLISLFYLGSSSFSWGGTKPKWESVLGIVNLQTTHYTGSNHYYIITLPFPNFFYRSDDFELGRSSKLRFYEGTFLQLDVGLDGQLPVESAEEDAQRPNGADDPKAIINQIENDTRRGMPDLPFTFFLGLRLKLFFTDHLVLDLPVLNGVTVGGGFLPVGNIVTPRISYDLFDRDSDSSFTISVAGLYGDSNYNNFYYEVKEENELADRPAYEADPGLVAVTYGVGTSLSVTERLTLFGFYAADEMQESVVKDSPLVISTYAERYAVGFYYSFFQSNETVTTYK